MNLGLKSVPKLTHEHVHLNPYSVMNVRLAAQILSNTIANILRLYYPQEMHGTAEVCEYMDNFFDCLNVRNQLEGIKKRKPFLEPYRNQNDDRFNWLENKFLKFLEKWKISTQERAGNFTQNARERMFLSWQTYEGLRITVYSTIEAAKFLLSEGMPFVLTERFNQDVLEEYFGRQCSMGHRNDNPDLYQFGYNSNTIRMQRSVVPVTGNTRGVQKQKRQVSWSTVDETPTS